MDRFIQIITNWEAIIQSLEAAAIFLLLIWLGTKIFHLINNLLAKLSKSAKISKITNERLRYGALTAGEEKRPQYAQVLLYRMSRPLLKSLMWLVLGILTQQIIGIYSVAVYVICLYFIYSAYEIVGPVKNNSSEDELKEKISVLGKELEELKNT